MAAALIIDRRGAGIEIASRGVLRVQYDDEVHRVGVHAIGQLVLLGNVALSTAVLRSCFDAGVDVVLLARRGRQPTQHLLPQAATGARLRHAQHLHYADHPRRMTLARRLIRAKIEQQALTLQARGIEPGLERFAENTATAADIATLMGIEGAASARYFERWGKLWQQPWSFQGRNRRPPRDPINALLSLSYGMATGYIGRLAALKGLELSIGFVHGPQRERPALALDLLELLRPRIDQWVWQLLNDSKALTPEHFSSGPAEGCRLSKTGRAIYFARWYMGIEGWLRPAARNALALVIRTLRQ
jgi:CRISPR-associated protein Cas1